MFFEYTIEDNYSNVCFSRKSNSMINLFLSHRSNTKIRLYSINKTNIDKTFA